jgi:Transposase DDE domain
VQFVKGRSPHAPDRPIDVMRRQFDSPGGRSMYAKGLGTVEPVCGNLQNKGMRRFTRRGQKKVDAQWKLYRLVQNSEKIAHHRRAA